MLGSLRDVAPEGRIELDLSNLRLAAFVIAGIAVVAATILWALFGSRARARRRMKRGTQQLVDRELVTLSGIVRPIDAPLVAPLSGVACVAYQSRARLFQGRSSTFVTDQPQEVELVRFVLETKQGRVVVETDRVALEATPSPIPGVARSKARELAFLARHGFGAERLDTAGFDEIVVPLGAVITVHGMIVIELDPRDATERGYRDDAASRMRLVAPGNQPVVIAPV